MEFDIVYSWGIRFFFNLLRFLLSCFHFYFFFYIAIVAVVISILVANSSLMSSETSSSQNANTPLSNGRYFHVLYYFHSRKIKFGHKALSTNSNRSQALPAPPTTKHFYNQLQLFSSTFSGVASILTASRMFQGWLH